MALLIDIKVNNTVIYKMVATRYEDTKPKGLNPYIVELYDADLNKLYKGLTSHIYEDGAIKLVQRMAQEICQNSSITTRN